MTPVLAIIGRPNVGKSSLFNALTKTRNALVADMPGVTRDRQYGEVKIGDTPFIVIDTGGLVSDSDGMEEFIKDSAKAAIEEADVLLFILDAKVGVTAEDSEIVNLLRKRSKPILVVANKIDAVNPSILSEFFELGLGEAVGISAVHRTHLLTLLERAAACLPPHTEEESEQNDEPTGIKIALVGRPNVGKSTLTNRMLGEERVIVCDHPGTTRDSIYIPFTHHNDAFTLIDTAGVRRQGRISEVVEKFSVIKTLQAIRDANVVIFLVDAREGLTDQDLRLLDFVIQSGRSLVFSVNKWDGLSNEQKENVKNEIDRRMEFLDFVETFFISALHGSNVGLLFDAVKRAYQSSIVDMPTPLLTSLLEKAVQDFNPPMVHGRRIKLKYMHCGGHAPPTLIIHGNQLERLPDSYLKYLERYFRKALKLIGTPIQIECKTSTNPYEGRHKTLTPRQERSGRKSPEQKKTSGLRKASRKPK